MFRAYDPERDRLVAIKLFRLDLPPERVHQLVAEFEKVIAAELAHPALVVPMSVGIAGNSPYLVHEFVAAESLDTIVREYGAAPAADALRVAAQLGGALDFAAVVHIDHGVLHARDILLASDTTKLTGIGVARALERVGVAAPIRRPYSAPERVAGAAWDSRADVFSLAALVHELLWARRVSGTGREAAQSLTEIAGGDLARLTDVFARALADAPHERYETALEFVNALKGAFPGITLGPSTAERRPPTADGRLPTESEPRLPLEVSEPDDFDLRRAEAERFSDAETEPLLAVTPLADAPPSEAPAVDAFTMPAREARVLAGPAAAPPPVPPPASRQRSGIMPIAFALLIGVALGFAGGYGVGSRDRLDDVPEAVATEAVPAPAVAARPAASPATATTGKTAAAPIAEAVPKPHSTPEAGAAVSGSLLVRSAPSGARVTVDGREYGRTPVTVSELGGGSHRVEIARDGYTPEERRVTITAAQPAHSVTVRLAPARSRRAIVAATGRQAPPRPSTPATAGRFTAPLVVDSRPAGAKVFLDGRQIGTTPMALSAVTAGEHALRIERDGYRAWSSSIRVIADQQNRVTASLER